MTDTVSRKVRSQIMSRIRGTGNERTDKAVASMLREAGIRGWRRHIVIKLPPTKSAMSVASDGTKLKPRVRPDFVFRSRRWCCSSTDASGMAARGATRRRRAHGDIGKQRYSETGNGINIKRQR